MVDTKQLISELSAAASPVAPVRPRRYAAFLIALLSFYAICAQCWLEGFRPDLLLQLARPLFVLELLLLAAMLASAAVASVYAMLPDGAARKTLMRLPYVFSCGMLALIVLQLLLPHDARMVMSEPDSHTHECTQYIAFSALLPAALIFGLLRRGASVMPMQAGLLAVIAAVSLGAITLRLAEANDEILHLLTWHYLPSLFFASLGALAGRYLLRW
ncbi:MAG: NrsF family protein [Alphaproteobacteria bacterium]|nr:NrsF family protein [Alphaproteobacteria bacterium]